MSGEALTEARSLEENCAELVERLQRRLAEIEPAIYARIREAVPDPVRGRDPAYQEGVQSAVRAVVSYSIEGLKRGPEWSGPVPPAAAAQARRAARVGVSLGTVLRRYVAGHGKFGDFIAEELERSGLSSPGSTLHHLRRTQAALLEHLTATVEQEYNHELQRVGRSPEQGPTEIVKRLLGGEPVATAELSSLRYELHASWHLGVIATGGGAGAAEEALRGLATHLGREILVVRCSEQTVWAWLGGQRRLAFAEIERLLLVSEFAGLSLAIGEPGRGIEGWCLTHRQTQEALLVALLGSERLTRYVDIALLTPWLQDPVKAQSLVELYLAPLYRQRGGAAALRQTLRAHFRTGYNVNKTAARLKVDRSTVRRRVRAIEEELGCPLHVRQAELEVAMRLEELLPSLPAEHAVADRPMSDPPPLEVHPLDTLTQVD